MSAPSHGPLLASSTTSDRETLSLEEVGMSALAFMFTDASRRARCRRDVIFRASFPFIGPETRILDLGSGDGANFARVAAGLRISPANVHAADLNAAAVQRAHDRFGFTPVVLEESGKLPFPDGHFDIAYCSSVIEHVTAPKSEVWSLRNGRVFRMHASVHQHIFAAELRRVAQAYFVQTPNRLFPIESHTWLPFMGYLPRPWLIRSLRVTNRIWIKRTAPDWSLLDRHEMAALFPDAQILGETVCGLTKSWMAIRTRRPAMAMKPAAELASPRLAAASPLAGSGA
jgi:2-polyprenyl-3-methyl-5-hydroxy-6-metoxy-1,4-benzoquinol methylase